jgi:histidinol-phosphate aminotransferase
MVNQDAIDRFMNRLPAHVIAVFDEAYIEFPDTAPDTLRYVREKRNVCVLRTFSKIHGLAALRVGYAIAPPHVAELLQKARQPFNVNAIAQAGALAALADTEHVVKTRNINNEGMAFYEQELKARHIEFVPSHANFLLVKTGSGDRVFKEMLSQGVIVRAMSSYKLPDWIRISIGTKEQNERCLTLLDSVLQSISQ